MTVLLIALLLCFCCAPASALSWGRVADKAKQVFDTARQAAKEAQPRKAPGFTGGPKSADPATPTATTTTVYDLLEDLYYLDDSVVDLWQNVKLALIVGAVVMALILMLQIVTLSLLSTIRCTLSSLRQSAEEAKKRQ
jgi:hypothetical protein